MEQTTKIHCIILIMFIVFFSCRQKSRNELETKNINKNESITVVSPNELGPLKHNPNATIFEIAYNNSSTAPSYIVFNAQNLNTGQIKEICCEAPFLSGAMHRELKKDYDEKCTQYVDSIILGNRNKFFKFKNKEALKNISFNEYPKAELVEKKKNEYDLKYYVNKYGKNDARGSLNFSTTHGFEREVFAHIMFKLGIITSRGCVSGNIIYFGNQSN